MPIALSELRLSIKDTLPLPNSPVRIPQLGFGVYRSTGKQCENACLNAFRVGHRHVDTAQFYGNENEVGEAVRLSGIDRRELFITTKVMSPGGSPDKTYEKLRDSVEKIAGVDGYVDLFLIHSARAGAAGRKEMWLALERLLEDGRTTAIGVSNFGIRHIEEMKAYATVWPPHVNQIELHPWCQQWEIVEYCQDLNIVVEAYCPLVRNYKAHEPTLVGISQKYNKTPAQILVRYSLQKGWVPLPKSENEDWIKDNANVYDFEISDQDMATLNALDQGSAGAIVEAVNND